MKAQGFEKRIIIQNLFPAFVATKMSMMRHSFWIPSAKVYVRAAVKTVGIMESSSVFWLHSLQAMVKHLADNIWFGSYFYTKITFQKLITIRKKYYTKMKRLQAN